MALSACALLSTPDPVQTYRFGGGAAATSAAAVASPVQVTLRRVEFPEAVEGVGDPADLLVLLEKLQGFLMVSQVRVAVPGVVEGGGEGRVDRYRKSVG